MTAEEGTDILNIRSWVLVGFFWVFGCEAFAQASEPAEVPLDALENIDDFLTSLAGSEFAPPGFAIVVVNRDGPLLVRGYGVSDIASELSVTAQTQFYNASVTKQFTALAAVRLDSRGVIDIDARVDDILPQIELPRRTRSRDITLRDFLTHSAHVRNSSIGFVTAYVRRLPPDEVFDQMSAYSRFVREDFRYGNFGYIVFDAALQELAQIDWREAVTSEILEPAGMHLTTPYDLETRPGAIALGHEAGQTGWVIVPPKPASLRHAAGGLFTTADDTAIWLQLMLNEGRLNGEQVLPAEDVVVALTPVVEQSRSFGSFNRRSYAMGWNVSELDGLEIYEHGGGYAGSRAWSTFMPEQGIGVAVLANAGVSANAFSLVVIQQVYDELLDREHAEDEATRRLQAFEELARQNWSDTLSYRASQLSDARFDLSSEDLMDAEGRYHNDRLGSLELRLDGARLVGSLDAMDFEFLRTTEPDVLVADPGPGLEQFIAPWTIRRDRDGNIVRIDWEHRRFERR